MTELTREQLKADFNQKARDRKQLESVVKNDFFKNGKRTDRYEVIRISALDKSTKEKLQNYELAVEKIIKEHTGHKIVGHFSRWIRAIKYTDNFYYIYDDILAKLCDQKGFKPSDPEANQIKRDLESMPILMAYKLDIIAFRAISDGLNSTEFSKLKPSTFGLDPLQDFASDNLYLKSDLIRLGFREIITNTKL